MRRRFKGVVLHVITELRHRGILIRIVCAIFKTQSFRQLTRSLRQAQTQGKEPGFSSVPHFGLGFRYTSNFRFPSARKFETSAEASLVVISYLLL